MKTIFVCISWVPTEEFPDGAKLHLLSLPSTVHRLLIPFYFSTFIRRFPNLMSNCCMEGYQTSVLQLFRERIAYCPFLPFHLRAGAPFCPLCLCVYTPTHMYMQLCMYNGYTVVSRIVTFPDGHFPGKTFPGKTFPG